MPKQKKHYSYNLYKIEKAKQQQLIQALGKAKMTTAGKKTIDGFQLTLYVSTDASSPVWWTELYHDYFQNQPTPENELYYAVFLLSNPDLCYTVTLGKAYQFVNDFADPLFAMQLAERIADLRWKNEPHQPAKRANNPGQIHSITATTTSSKWGDNITFGQSVQFDLPISPDKLPALVKKIEAELAKPANMAKPTKVGAKDIKSESAKNQTNHPVTIEHIATCQQCGEHKEDSYCEICKQDTAHNINIILNDPLLVVDVNPTQKSH